ncbi:unnamed protein product [Schistocephalus solidus]|uniref:alanine transaminase n=1 Tax=Schistocephalus solidus TaxID=70667 RepID=A0A183SP99_SCHSO|nr:unnamed protein product [Schistocephalus solidus]
MQKFARSRFVDSRFERLNMCSRGVAMLRKSPVLMTAIVRNYTKLLAEEINPNMKKLEYAVRGPIVQRALEIEKVLRRRQKGEKKAFDSVIKCNIGDCHSAGQSPISFLRDVVAVASNNKLMDSPLIPYDAKERAKRFLASTGGSVGAYSQSTGVEIVREDVAAYIKERDGIEAISDDIFLSSGASEAVKFILELVSTTKEGNQRAGVMVPIPQYPLYSATLSEFNNYQIGYYLEEDKGWGLNVQEMERVLSEAKKQCIPRAIVIINPGNPTGQVLNRSDIEAVIHFAHRHNLLLIADEVYQHNIYAANRKFHSFKRVLHDIGEPISSELQLASMMSASKGFMGECGFRGGYCELVNFDPQVKAELYKCLSSRLCPSTLGQLILDVVVNPPREGEPSFQSFNAEKSTILASLRKKAKLVETLFNELPGFECQPVMGAMYAFPRLDLPEKALEAAKEKKMPLDTFYVTELLEKTGVCVVPGTGFGQKPGTYHFR